MARARNLDELYDDIERIKDLTLFYLFFYWEPLNFQEVVSNKIWRDAMDDEMKAIMKSDIWQFFSFPKGIKLSVLNG